MARPTISDDLYQLVEELYREAKGESPPNFETALATVTELASAQLNQETGWYPGKYAKRAFSAVTGENTERTTGPSRPRDQGVPSIDPSSQAIFKTVLDDAGTVEIPPAERRALGWTSETLLQVIAYRVEPTTEPDHS